VILRGDELERVVLALCFEADGVGDLRIDLRERALQKIVTGGGALFVNGGHFVLLRRVIPSETRDPMLMCGDLT